jgi:murein DD-endopeptidase MepM/ murein hydrolase activator NlpD
MVPNPFNPQDFNRYSYVRNNPTRYIDPTGHVCTDPDDLWSPSCESGRSYPNNAWSAERTNPISWFSPVRHPVVDDGYDWLDDNGTVTRHVAVDIDASLDDEIIASADGVVLSSDACSADPCESLLSTGAAVNGGYGNVLVIEYPYDNLPFGIRSQVEAGQSIYILYAHLAHPSSLQPGDTVAPGQVIGLAGTTGYSTGVHLHLEVRVGNNLPSLPMATDDFNPDNALWQHWWAIPPINPHDIFPIESME